MLNEALCIQNVQAKKYNNPWLLVMDVWVMQKKKKERKKMKK